MALHHQKCSPLLENVIEILEESMMRVHAPSMGVYMWRVRAQVLPLCTPTPSAPGAYQAARTVPA